MYKLALSFSRYQTSKPICNSTHQGLRVDCVRGLIGLSCHGQDNIALILQKTIRLRPFYAREQNSVYPIQKVNVITRLDWLLAL